MLTKKIYLQISGFVFAIVGLLHLTRFFMGYDMVCGPWQIPMWLSLVAGVVLWYLAYISYKLVSK
ncbi:MAG: hypothetical protein ABH812_01100 [bacterium]